MSKKKHLSKHHYNNNDNNDDGINKYFPKLSEMENNYHIEYLIAKLTYNTPILSN